MFGNNVTLIELLDDWLENYHRYEVKPQTYLRYRCCAEYIREGSIAEKNIKKISRKDVMDFMAELRSVKSKSTGKPLSVSTMDMTLTVIQMVFSFAEEYGYVKESPCKNVKRPCKPKGYGKDAGKMRCLDLSEQLRLEQYIAQSANTEYYGYILDLYTGLRMGELLALTWDDIDFEKGLLYVNKSVYYQKDENGCWTRMTGSPKSKTSFREIPLPEHVIKDLAYLKERAKGENIVSFADGRPISPRLFRWRYDKILSSLKIRKVNFHGLRHTFATRAIENGVDLKTLSEILGHSNPGITMRIYTHSTTEHKRIAMNSMTRLIDKYR